MYVKLRNIILILFVFTTFSFQVSAQTSEFRNKFDDADYYFLFEEYSKAIKLYLELYNVDKSNANINYLVGLCYIQSVKDIEKRKAIPYLEYASKNINPKYKEGKFKEKKAPIYSLFYLAFAYKLNNEFEKAIETYRTYITYLKPGEKEEIHNSLKEIEACYYAIQLIQVPVNLETVKGNEFAAKNNETKSKTDSTASGNIDNSFVKATSSETFPIVSSDGSFMVFSMGLNNVFPQEVQSLNFDFDQYKTDDIYYAVKNADGKWETPINIMKQLNPKSQVAPVCISHDGKTLYLVQDDNDDGNIYSSKFENGNWQPMTMVKGDINTHKWESHASLSQDDKTIYFTSARKGGFGKLDIYKSTINEKGEWGKAENLGSVINTDEDEETPFLLPDGKTLFFSSRGHKNIGGFDIFSSKFGNDGTWTVPLNVGYSINTVNNDFAYINQIDKQLVYTPLNRTELRSNFSNAEDKDNSYKLALNTENPTTPYFNIKGTVVFKTDKNSYPDKFEISVMDSAKNVKLTNIVKDELSGEYSFKASSGVYYIKYTTAGYKEMSQRILLPEIYTPSTINIIAELVPEDAGKDVVSQTEIVYDYEKNFPERFESKKINLLAVKNKRDSIRLFTRNEIVNNDYLKNNVDPDLTKNTDAQVTVDKNKDAKTNDSKNKNNQQDNKNITAENKDSKTNDSKNKNNQQDNKNITAENKDSKTNDSKNKNNQQDNKNITAENKNSITNDINNQNNKENNKNILTENKDIKNNKVQTDSKSSTNLSGSTVVKNILFDFDCVKPKDFKDNLDKLANYLVNNNNCKIIIEGHSDNQGEENYKQIISEMRADFVLNYLVKNGALKSNITAKGYSSTNPVASEKSPDTRKYNRRAEYKISEGCTNLIIESIVVPDYAKNTGSVTTSSGNVSSVTIGNLLFSFDSLNISESSNLDKLALFLKQNPTCVIEIVGHSDAQGESSYKQFVSEERANNIKKILVKKGVNPANLNTRGESDSKQISINNSPQTRKYNRRVEFIVLKEGTQKLIVNPVNVPPAFLIK